MLKLALALILFGAVVGDQCPPPTLTRPCECDTAGGLTLRCDNINSKDVLEGVFRRTGNFAFGNLQISHSSLPSIPVRDSLVPKSIHAFAVLESNLTTLFDEVPSQENVVSMLSLEYVRFGASGVPWQQLANLKRLRYLNFYGVDIPVLDSRFKRNVNKDLNLLLLEKTNTDLLEDRVFSEFQRLRDLRVTGGRLRELKRSHFPTPTILGYVGFDDNQISSLPDDIFSDMPSLQIVSLKRNKLTTLSEEVFGQVYDQLVTLDVTGNPIKCDCSIRWLTSREKRRHVKGRCESPGNLKGKSLSELKPTDFDACH